MRLLLHDVTGWFDLCNYLQSWRGAWVWFTGTVCTVVTGENISYLHLRESERAQLCKSFLPLGGCSVKLSNKPENCFHRSCHIHVEQPYVMQLNKHFNNEITILWIGGKNWEKKWIWGKDYGLGRVCGGSCQICLPEARCSLAHFIHLNIVLIQCWRPNKQVIACGKHVTDSSPVQYSFMARIGMKNHQTPASDAWHTVYDPFGNAYYADCDGTHCEWLQAAVMPGDSAKRSQAKHLAWLEGGHAVTRKHVLQMHKASGTFGVFETCQLNLYTGSERRGESFPQLLHTMLWMLSQLVSTDVHGWCS